MNAIRRIQYSYNGSEGVQVWVHFTSHLLHVCGARGCLLTHPATVSWTCISNTCTIIEKQQAVHRRVNVRKNRTPFCFPLGDYWWFSLRIVQERMHVVPQRDEQVLHPDAVSFSLEWCLFFFKFLSAMQVSLSEISTTWGSQIRSWHVRDRAILWLRRDE